MQQIARANAKGTAAIRRLKEVLHLQERIEANTPSFGKFLGLCVSPSETGSCSVCPTSDEHTLVFRYKFPPYDRLKYLETSSADNNTIRRPGPSLSTYTSILDEVTTQSLIAAAKKHPRPGVSVTLQTKWGPAAHTAEALKEVDIVSTVTKKGRTLGFVRAEVRNPADNGLICYFDHVKYLPTTWLFGLLVSPIGIVLLDFVLKYLAPYFRKTTQTADENHKGILDALEYTSDTSATFRYNQQHANGVGGLHGGIQSILMEHLGTRVAQKEFGANAKVECERLQVSYQSSASKAIELKAHIMEPPKDKSLTLRIEILRTSTKPNAKRTVVSEGILTFTASSKKDQ